MVDHFDEIKELDGFGLKSAQNIVNAITKARTVKDQKLLYALTIPLVGQDVAKRLLAAYDLDALVDSAIQAVCDDVFATIDGIGPEKSAAFVRWCKDPKNIKILEEIKKEVIIERTEQVEAGHQCEGLTFVVTGDVHHYKNRKELKAYIESMGGKVTGSVSRSTSYLINNDVQSASSKNKKAQQLGIPILSEDEFIERFGE